MRDPTIFDKIDLHLIRVLHTVLTERSVSRAAIGRPWPVGFARMRYLQLWHERAHAWASARWLRERVKSVASKLLDDPASVAAKNR